jgi:hypothetical protein
MIGGCSPRQDLVLVFDLADIEAIAQKVEQRPAPKRNTTPGGTRSQQSCLGPDIPLFEITNQGVDAVEFEIAFDEDKPDSFGLRDKTPSTLEARS